MSRVLTLSALAVCVAALSGCTLVVGGQVDPLRPDPRPDLQYDLTAFEPHIGQLTELFLVSDDGFIQARAIYEPLPAADLVIRLRNAVEPDVRRVDFYSDLNENGRIDPSEPDPLDPMRRLFPDHMWRDRVAEDGSGAFMHSTNFTDIVTDDPAQVIGGDFELRLTDVEAFVDQPARVWVVDPNGRDVGFYHRGGVTVPLALRIPGIVDDGTEYRVVVELGDEAARCTTARGSATGLVVDVSLQSLTGCDP